MRARMAVVRARGMVAAREGVGKSGLETNWMELDIEKTVVVGFLGTDVCAVAKRWYEVSEMWSF